MGAQDLALVGLAGSTLGTALALPMVWPGARRAIDVRLLGGTLLSMAAIAALISARLAGIAPASVGIEHAINLIGLSAAPALFFYARYATGASIASRSAALAIAPAVLYLVTLCLRSILGEGTRVPFAWLLPVVLAFTLASVATLFAPAAQRRATAVPVEWVVGFVVLLNVAQIVRMEFRSVELVRAVVPLVLGAGFLSLAMFAAWRSLASAPAAPFVGGPRYERSGLDDTAAMALLERITVALTRDRLFARADLTLADLAAAVGGTPHHVSEVLNRHAGGSFTEAINKRRVEDVKAQLLDPASERFTIEGIGASAGFGSRSALYAAFKRYEGMTPAAFRGVALEQRDRVSDCPASPVTGGDRRRRREPD
jgi:AraC-like DNA-binding protein